MSFHRSATGLDAGDVSLAAMSPTDRHAAIQREELERATLRQERLASQRSHLNSPEERIQIWERLHALALPRSSTHSLVRVIATQTDLSVAEVQQVQRRRAGAADAPQPIEETP